VGRSEERMEMKVGKGEEMCKEMRRGQVKRAAKGE
jgi:hypothetical protein